MKPQQQPDVLLKELSGETILYRNEEQAIHVLNPTAKLIWELSNGQHSVADMEQIIRQKFKVPPEHDVTADIKNTLQTLNEKGLLTY